MSSPDIRIKFELDAPEEFALRSVYAGPGDPAIIVRPRMGDDETLVLGVEGGGIPFDSDTEAMQEVANLLQLVVDALASGGGLVHPAHADFLEED